MKKKGWFKVSWWKKNKVGNFFYFFFIIECSITLNNNYMIYRIRKKKKLRVSRKTWVSQETLNEPNFYFGLIFKKKKERKELSFKIK